jgi:bacterioferritin-associated ferredoxin
MIVCHCKAVSDRTIRTVVREGADTRRQVALACGAGRTCGGCRPAIDELISEEQDSGASLPAVLAATG